MTTSHEIIWLVFHIFVVAGFVFLFACVISMGIYDIKMARKKKAIKQKLKPSRVYRINPTITVIVPAFNEELVIERCLASIIRVDYKKVNIVVVNDASTDKTAGIVRAFIRTHPQHNIRLVNLRRNRGKGGALNFILKQYCNTELVMVLDSDCTLKRDAVTKAVKYFTDPSIMGLATHVRVAAQPAALSYLQKIEYLVGFRHKQYFSLTNSEFIISGQGSTYRTDIVKYVKGFNEKMLTEDIALSLSIAKLGNKIHRLVYASDVIVHTEAPPTLRSLYRQRYRWKMGGMQAIYANRTLVLSRSKKHSFMLTFIRLPQAIIGEITLIFEPLLLLLFLFVAISSHSLAIFFGGWFTLTVYTLSIILIDEYSTGRERTIMAAIMPFMYPFFYLLTIINVIAMFQCIRNWRKIIGINATKGTWISPDRIGHSIAP